MIANTIMLLIKRYWDICEYLQCIIPQFLLLYLLALFLQVCDLCFWRGADACNYKKPVILIPVLFMFYPKVTKWSANRYIFSSILHYTIIHTYYRNVNNSKQKRTNIFVIFSLDTLWWHYLGIFSILPLPSMSFI